MLFRVWNKGAQARTKSLWVLLMVLSAVITASAQRTFTGSDQVDMQNRMASDLQRVFLPRPQFDPPPPLGEIEKSMENARRGLALQEAGGDKVGQATSHAALALFFVQMGSIEQAQAQLRLAENMVDASGDPKIQLQLLGARAALLMTSGEFEQAIKEYQRIATVLREMQDDNDLAEVQIRLAGAYQSVGDLPGAFKSYEDARALFSQLKNKDGETRVALGVGSLYESIGEFAKASNIYTHSRDNASGEQYARMLVSVGGMYLADHKPVEALVEFKKALVALKGETDEFPLKVSIFTGLSRCQMALSQYDEAENYLYLADSMALGIGNRRLEAGVVATMGELQFWKAITARLDNAYNQTRIPDAGQYFSKAIDAYQKALKMSRETGDRVGEAGILADMGLAYDSLGKHSEALQYYLAALDKLEDLITLARLEEFRVDLANEAAGLYRRAIELEANENHMEEAFRLSERARARSFLDQIGNHRVDSYENAPKQFVQQEDTLRRRNISLQHQLAQEVAKPAPDLNMGRIQQLQTQLAAVQHEYQETVLSLKLSNPTYASFRSISPMSVSEIQERLPADVTVVSYFTMSDMTLAFVITRSKFYAKKLRVGEAQLTEAVDSFLDFAGFRTESAVLNILSSWLIKPIRSHITNPKLVLVPHGPLNDLPFAALSPLPKQYLADRYAISYLPSVSALGYLSSSGKHGLRVLVLANNQEEGAPRLVHAYEEAQLVSLQGTDRILEGDPAAISRLQDLADDYDIIHLIGHVYLNRDHSQLSRISVGTPTERAGTLDFDRILRLNLRHISLVVLSGCQTQTGVRSRGDEVAALSRAFLYAGSKSVIATLWSVDDRATKDLMVAFYSHLRTGAIKAQALRLAQTALRQKYNNPYYWAGFVLMGDSGEFISQPSK